MTAGRTLRLYAPFARCAFQRLAAYRLANWTGIAVNFFFFLIHAQVYLAFFGARERVAGWSPQDAVLYFATSEALLMAIGLFYASQSRLRDGIRSGDVVLDLARPTSLYARVVAEHFGQAGYYLLMRTTVLYAGAALLYGLAPPLEPRLLLFPVALGLAVGVSALLSYLANATAFWLEHALGPVAVLIGCLTLFGGMVVPLDFYPDALRRVCDVLPFRAAVYTPVALATGRLEGGALAFGLLHQLAWLLALVHAARLLERRGVRHLAVHGG